MRIETVELKPAKELHQELRERILDLLDVTEKQNAGIHDDAFYVGRTMFMHIHGRGHFDIRLSKTDQKRVLAEGRARPHHWAPQAGYVTSIVKNKEGLGTDNGTDSDVPSALCWHPSKLRQRKSVIEIYTADFVSPKFICVLIREQCRLSASVQKQHGLVVVKEPLSNQVNHPCCGASCIDGIQQESFIS